VDGAVTVHVEPITGQTIPVADLERRVTIDSADCLPTGSAAGKHRWVVSHIKDQAGKAGVTP
jgi:hypothetical protein